MPRAALVVVETWDVRVVVFDLRILTNEEIHDLQRRRLAVVLDVLLVGDADDENSGAPNRTPMAVERPSDEILDEIRHVHVDLAGEFDEANVKIELARLPCQIERIERNAVSADTRSRIESHNAERLGGSGVDHFP